MGRGHDSKMNKHHRKHLKKHGMDNPFPIQYKGKHYLIRLSETGFPTQVLIHDHPLKCSTARHGHLVLHENHVVNDIQLKNEVIRQYYELIH